MSTLRKPKRGRDDRPAKRKFIKLSVEEIDYKNVNLLRRFVTEKGKIRSRRITGLSKQQQAAVAREIKRAREMALLPYQTR